MTGNQPPPSRQRPGVGASQLERGIHILQQQGWAPPILTGTPAVPCRKWSYAVLAEMMCAASPAFIYYPALTTGAFKVIQAYCQPRFAAEIPARHDGRALPGLHVHSEPSAGTMS